MIVSTAKQPDLSVLASAVQQMDAEPGVQSLLLLGASRNGYGEERLRQLLRDTRKPLFGGLFPKVFFGAEALESGFALVGLPHPGRQRLITGLSGPRNELVGRMERALDELGADRGTLFVLLDGLSGHIDLLVERVYRHFGRKPNYLGGGCGGAEFQSIPCVFGEGELMGDAAVLAWYPELRSHIGVAHGWCSISEVMKVTSAQGGRIDSLDWRPAFEVYREFVERHAGVRIDKENFSEYARAYPFGVSKLDAEMVVRDPFAVEGDAIRCFGDVPTGSLIHILHGDKGELLTAAERAEQRAWLGVGDEGDGQCIVFDCISRSLFLREDFETELQRLAAGPVPMVGALSLGEIASSGEDHLEFLNKTVVKAVLQA